MIEIKNSEIIQISDKLYALKVQNKNELNLNVDTDVTIIYFGLPQEQDETLMKMSENKYVKKIVTITKRDNKKTLNKVKHFYRIPRNIASQIDGKMMIVINNNNDYKESRYIVKNLIKLVKYIKNIEKRLMETEEKRNVLTTVVSNDSKYAEDIINCIKASLIKDKGERYTFIYDTVCDYLDSKFKGCNVCDFKDDKCIANREGKINHTEMGCCHSFEYCKFYEWGYTKNMKLCQYMQNRQCTTKNISCKLYTCRYIQKRHEGFKFNTRKILLLDCFFTQKQHDIIRYNFFKTREEIIKKLQKRNFEPYCLYLARRSYNI